MRKRWEKAAGKSEMGRKGRAKGVGVADEKLGGR